MRFPDDDVIAKASHLEYLILQRGFLDHLKQDRSAWLEAYQLSLRADFNELVPHLPDRCNALVDVGSGLGGIDILLARHYRETQGHEPLVFLLDGEHDAPQMRAHNVTFSNLEAARDLFAFNRVQLPLSGNTLQKSCRQCDLILSLQAWCFHLEPAKYDWVVQNNACEHTCIAVDVRKSRPDWKHYVLSNFGGVMKARDALKYQRLVGYKNAP